jgi:Domain of unknown function (DUF4395)
MEQPIDQNALRFNQALIVVLLVLGFVLGEDRGGVWLVVAVSVSLAIGAAFPGRGPFQLLYREVLVRFGLIDRTVEPGDPAPHRFAQGLGAACLAVSAVLLWAGAETVGWVVAWLVIALAMTNLLFSFCLGCFIYLHLGRFRQRRRMAT